MQLRSCDWPTFTFLFTLSCIWAESERWAVLVVHFCPPSLTAAGSILIRSRHFLQHLIAATAEIVIYNCTGAIIVHLYTIIFPLVAHLKVVGALPFMFFMKNQYYFWRTVFNQLLLLLSFLVIAKHDNISESLRLYIYLQSASIKDPPPRHRPSCPYIRNGFT